MSEARWDNTKPARRNHRIDQLRGCFVIGMTIFHALYMLTTQEVIQVKLWSGFWWWFARFVAAGFVLLAGWSLAAKRYRSPQRKLIDIRLIRLVLVAASISGITLIGFGRQFFIFFGVLHLISVATILAWPLAQKPKTAFVCGILSLGLGLYLGQFRFDFAWLAWLGLRNQDLYPMDYLPLLPWFGWFCFGCALHPLANQTKAGRPQPAPRSRPTAQALAWLGRHSLIIYLTHVPILFLISWFLAKIL